jgi:hypothetical protein
MNKSSMQNQSAHEDGKIVDQAKQAVTHVASNVASQAKEQVNAQFDTRKDKAVETIGNVATAIRETGDKLKGVGPLGDVAGRAADGMEKVADFFEGKQVGDVVRDVERFARREPALFIGAAFALGLIGGRFLKSSAHRSAGGGNLGTSYARSGGSDYGRYETSYSSSFDDDQYDYLSDADLQDDIDSQRFGGYGSQRVGRTTQPMGSRTGSGSSMGGSSMSGSSMGGSSGSSMSGSSMGTSGSSFGTSTSGSSSGSTGTTTTTTSATKTPSTAPSASTSTSTSKNGLGGGGGSTGSV